MKLLSCLLCITAACCALSACDSTAPKTVPKTLHDTLFQNDRFAKNAAVVDGEWTIITLSDTADAFFFQDSNSVSAYLVWKKSSTWILTGHVTDTGLTLYTPAKDLAFYGIFTDSSHWVKTAMSGNYLNLSVLPTGSIPTWKATRKI